MKRGQTYFCRIGSKHNEIAMAKTGLSPFHQRVAAVAVAALALLTAGAIHREATRPGSVFLRAHPEGEWIRDGDPFFLTVDDLPAVRAYRTRIEVVRVPATAPLVLRTTGRTAVRIDGEPIADLPEPIDWNEPRSVELAPKLTPGAHELEIEVTHFGASVVAAAIAPLHVATDAHWLAKGRDGVWRPAALAEAPAPPRLAQEMTRFAPPARRWLAASAAVSLLLAWLLWRRHAVLRSSPAQFRTLLLALWALVAGNDFLRLPSWMGMDHAGHLEYVQFILDRRALPLANDGWQMFQSPLYYLLCAGIASLFGEWNGLVVRTFRLIGIASALAQIEISYRLARRVFPDRADLQKVATLVSGLLPMGFCISQGVGNEPLHGALGALTLLCAVRVAQREGPLAKRDPLLLGSVFGLALLAKVTAVLLAAPLCFALWMRIRREPRAWPREAGAAATACLATLCVAGWYYARNWLALGAPFVAGWLPRQTTWWQEPGYRMAEQLTAFGTALVLPFLSVVHGFWDGFYATLWADGNVGSITDFPNIPPWNYAPMLASVWVAILPSALIATGIVRALAGSDAGRGGASRDAIQIGVVALAAQIAALLVVFAQVPIYSQVKATYALALTPIFGLLAASGVEGVSRSQLARVATIAGLGGWSALVICSYFVI